MTKVNVNYNTMPGMANQIRQNGQELNNELQTARTSIESVNATWYGKSYNDLALMFEGIIPQINEMLELIVGEIPFALETIANNYAAADGQTSAVVAPNKTEPNNLVPLNVNRTEDFNIDVSEVENLRTGLTRNFSNARDKMNTAESIYNSIQWQSSQASEAFRARFTKLKSEIISAFEEIDSHLSKVLQEQINRTEEAESQSTMQ